MRIRESTRIVLAALVLVAAIAAAGCGSSSDTSSTAPKQNAGAVPGKGAPAGAAARVCESDASVDGEIRVSGAPCGLGDLLAAAWHKEGGCSPAEGASRTSCTLGDFTCLGTATGQGLAVDCAGRGRSVSFLAEAR
jgi:hypothetical protein